jgi:hypothetical protein
MAEVGARMLKGQMKVRRESVGTSDEVDDVRRAIHRFEIDSKSTSQSSGQPEGVPYQANGHRFQM